jgi:CBS domain containing-hemolysin-like protein
MFSKVFLPSSMSYRKNHLRPSLPKLMSLWTLTMVSSLYFVIHFVLLTIFVSKTPLKWSFRRSRSAKLYVSSLITRFPKWTSPHVNFRRQKLRSLSKLLQLPLRLGRHHPAPKQAWNVSRDFNKVCPTPFLFSSSHF